MRCVYRTTALLCSALLLFSCATTTTPPSRTVAGVTVATPLPAQPVSDTFYGVAVDDP